MKKAALFISIGFFLTACGVKGPPLPPLATTPEQSDRQEQSLKLENAPVASPTPTVSKKKTKKTTQ